MGTLVTSNIIWVEKFFQKIMQKQKFEKFLLQNKLQNILFQYLFFAITILEYKKCDHEIHK